MANTSHHLRRLADYGLIASRKDGRRVTYELAFDDVNSLWRTLQAVAEARHAGLDDRLAGMIALMVVEGS